MASQGTHRGGSAEAGAERGGPSTLDLLWGEGGRPRRGPKPKLDTGRIVAAAIGIADAEGLDAVTMQRVAGDLGFTTMSLYRYVSGKEQLVELMSDSAIGEAPEADPAADWRDELRTWCRALYRRGLRRPWVLSAPISTPPRGPVRLTWLDRALGALDRAGVDAASAMSLASFLSISVMSMARLDHDLQRAAAAAGATAGEADDAYAGILARAAGTGRYPHIAALLAADLAPLPDPSWDPAAALSPETSFALERLLDGVESFAAQQG